MELFETKKHFIIVNKSVALFCDRLSGQISFSDADELSYEWNPVCLGEIKGIIGKIKLFPDGESKLMLISKLDDVGTVPIIGPISRITKVTTISLNTLPLTNLDINLCKRHHFGIKKTERITNTTEGQKPFIRTFNEHLKSAAESVKPKRKDVRDREKFERRILEEYDKMFQESNSGDLFYVSVGSDNHGDVTTNIQTQQSKKYNSNFPLWRRADERFFWNKFMLQEAIESAEQLLTQKFGKSVFTDLKLPESTQIVIRHIEQMLSPILNGYIQIEPFNLYIPTHSPVKRNLPNLPQTDVNHEYGMTVALISRRNRYRAGTRFRRRGVDDDGNVANYVETEQILKIENDRSPHVVSFVQIRGSVPVYWSQFSMKYRPPIILERSEEENQSAFQKHFNSEFQRYDKVIIVNLVDTSTDRPERKMADVYLHHLIKFNSSRLTCIMFDFHDYCRGLQFDNISVLIKGIMEIFRDMKYTWVDKNGLICEQKSIFRVNCVDCLDRTNVVLCMLAGVVAETQMRKLGLLSPEESLPAEFHRIMQFMWANNGDALSRQYSGTAAMKGDFTRTGTRTMNGLVKDGMSSVNRYYMRLREMSRQAAIDLMIGNENSTEVVNLLSGRNDSEQRLVKQKEDNIKELAAQCKRACLKSEEECLAESILIFCNENEKDFQDMNTVSLVTSQKIYFVRIDFQQKRQPLAIVLPLKSIRKVQIGYEPLLFRSRQPIIRLYYDPPKSTDDASVKDKAKPDNSNEKSNSSNNENSCFLAFKQPSLRLFNNILIDVRRNNDNVESLRAVAESFYVTAKSMNPDVQFDDSMVRLDKTKSEAVPPEWITSVNIGHLYENVILSSSLNAFNEDFEEIDDPVDAGYIDVSDKDISDKDVSDKDVSDKDVTKPLSNMDVIKQGFSRVKDKVKIKDWRERFATSMKNAPFVRMQKQNKTENDETDNVQMNSLVRLNSVDLGITKHDENNLISDIKPEEKEFLSAARSRLGSSSDDESTRRSVRDNRSGFRPVKSMSDNLTLNSVIPSIFTDNDVYESSNEDECLDYQDKILLQTQFETDDTFEFDPVIQKSLICTGIDTVPTNELDTSSNALSKSTSQKAVVLKRSMSLNDITEQQNVVLRKRSSILDQVTIDGFSLNCGFIFGGVRGRSFKKSVSFLLHSTVQLAAATGGAYQRRAERISLQLSIDEASNVPRKLRSPSKSPKLTRQQKFQEIFRQSIAEKSLSKEDQVDNGADSGNDDPVEIQNIYTYINLPFVDIQNQKAFERLTSKQIEMALFVEEIRKKIYGNNVSLETNMIIF